MKACPPSHPFARLSLLLCVALSACSSTQAPKLPSMPELPSVPAVTTVKPTNKDSSVTDRVGQAAITPLSDLNVVQEEIPAILLHAQEVGPYGVPSPATCEAVQQEINDLDGALGADLDSPKDGNKPSLLERGTDLAENTGVGMVRRTMEGFVPFRSWLRKLSGAEKHSKRVAGAIVAGGVRRAYLKGLRQGLGCPLPAVPADPAAQSTDAGATRSASP